MKSKSIIYPIVWLVITIAIIFLFPVIAIAVYHLIRYWEYVTTDYINEHYYDFFVNGLLASFIIAGVITLAIIGAIEELSEDYAKIKKGKELYKKVETQAANSASLTQGQKKLVKHYKSNRKINIFISIVCITGILMIVIMIIVLKLVT